MQNRQRAWSLDFSILLCIYKGLFARLSWLMNARSDRFCCTSMTKSCFATVVIPLSRPCQIVPSKSWTRRKDVSLGDVIDRSRRQCEREFCRTKAQSFRSYPSWNISPRREICCRASQSRLTADNPVHMGALFGDRVLCNIGLPGLRILVEHVHELRRAAVTVLQAHGRYPLDDRGIG